MRPSEVIHTNPPHIKITSLKTTSKSFLKNIKNNINNIYQSIDLWILQNIKNNELIQTENVFSIIYLKYNTILTSY